MNLEIARGRQAYIYIGMAYLARTAAGLGATVGIVVLTGWAFDIEIVKSLGPNLATMKTNTALSMLLAGISLWLLVDQSRPKWRSWLGYGCATLLLAIGFLTLCEMAFSLDIGIDQLLFAERVLSSNTSSPNRMGINSAACIALSGLSLLLIDLRIWRGRISQSLALGVGVISLSAVVGYVFSVQALYAMHLYTGMAIHTAGTLLILSMGILLARPQAGFMSTVSLDSPSGLLVRQLLPIALVLPTFAGWLTWEAQKLNYIDTATGIIVFASFNTIVLIGFTYVGVILLNRLINQVRQSEERLGLMISGVKDYAILTLDPKGYVTSWNMGAERIKGYQASEIIGQHFSKFYTSEAQAENHPGEELGEAIKTGRYEEEGWRVRKNGTRFFANVIITAIRNQDGSLAGFSKVTRDITERKEAAEVLFFEKEQAQVTLNSIGDGVICTDILGNITFLNLVAEKMTGWILQEAKGQPTAEVFQVVDATTRKLIANPGSSAIVENRTMHLPPDCVLVRRDAFEIPIEDSISPIHDREGQPTGAVIVFRDVSAAKATALQMTHSAQHDFLTGLPNRMLLNDRIQQAITLAPRHGKKIAVLFLDLDGFKHINDSLGHAVGDELLKSVATRLSSCVRGSDTVSRQGGDEFVVLLSEMGEPEDAAITARRMLDAVADVHTIGEQDLHITTCIGVSVFPNDGLDAETLIKNADTAMYQAKENGRQGYQFFKQEMNVRAVKRQSLEENLRRALARNELLVHYQPKISLRTGEITGAEALLRWTRPDQDPIPPGEFIPVAEDSGLILPIGRWVLREACRQARSWMEAGLPLTSVAVNVSAVEFRDEKFLDGLFAILEETRLDAKFLELELTESVLMKRAESTKSILTTLRERGVQLAVDDFGTGYSSLAYLTKFPVDALKIDQSFVSRTSRNCPDEGSIVAAIIGIGRSLGLRTIAEGVETEEQLAYLQANHCDEAQGFYFSRPVPPEQFAKLLKLGVKEIVHR